MIYERKKVRSRRSNYAHEFELIIECKGKKLFGGLQAYYEL